MITSKPATPAYKAGWDRIWGSTAQLRREYGGALPSESLGEIDKIPREADLPAGSSPRQGGHMHEFYTRDFDPRPLVCQICGLPWAEYTPDIKIKEIK